LGQASRISGVTPAAISLLLVHLKKKRGRALTGSTNGATSTGATPTRGASTATASDAELTAEGPAQDAA
jgi:tRNA uridine 5-carboxymethylaminomethyl modification enzyme